MTRNSRQNGFRGRRIAATVILALTLCAGAGTAAMWIIPNGLAGGGAEAAVQGMPSGGPRMPARMIRTGTPRKPRPATLDPRSFSEPEIRMAYQAAKEVPQVMEQLPCYCGCFSYDGHQNNLDCFVDNHGVECLMCRAIALEAKQQHSLGTPFPEIKRRVDEKWAPRPQPGR